ncbi:MAG: hypothetical protein IPJ32_02070 [Sphingobacteriaceae bacterium]|nr:hypothetical protein [Sphingobacteriaceae bacterium]
MKKVCVFAVIYPANIDYLDDFLISLSEQDFKEFDILLFNDGVIDLYPIIDKYKSLNIIVHGINGNTAQNRQRGMDILVESNYEQIIFGDTDDYFSSNRISLSIELLKKHDVVVNDVTLVDKKGAMLSELYFSNRMTDGFVFDYKFIADKNILGFSNTAINRKVMSKLEMGNETVAIDWYFFGTAIAKEKLKVIFTNRATTYYRQHEQNTVGLGRVTEESILKAIKIKLQHYKLLSATDDLFLELYNKFSDLNNKLKNSDFKRNISNT